MNRSGNRQYLVLNAELFRQLRGIVERFLRGEAEWQHHAAHLVRAERIHCDGGTQRRVDTARNTEQHTGKACLADIVTQTEHTGGIVALVAVEHRRHRSLATPATLALRPAKRRDVFLKARQLERERTIGIQTKRRAVEHQFVLTADLIEIDQRQTAFGNARDGDRQTHVVLLARVRRTVRHDQNFGAGLGQALDDVLVFFRLFHPCVFTDGDANPHAADRYRSCCRPARKHALFVEYAVVRKVSLETQSRDPAFIQQCAGIIELAVFHPRRADQNRRTAISGFPRQRFNFRAAGRLKRRLEDQIFGRIARDKKLGQHQQIGTVGYRLCPRRAGPRGIASDITDDGIELCKRDRELGFGHDRI